MASFHQRVGVSLAVILLLVPVGRSQSLVLSRPVRPWEFLCSVGQRAGIFGNESGNVEAWVYPLKILHNFHVNFLTEGRVIHAEDLGRTVFVRPESTTILYSGDTFSVKETFFAPVHEPGAVISFEIQTDQPLDIETIFERDLQLEWPAAIGGTYIAWGPALRAFVLGEESKKYTAVVGSPTATDPEVEFYTNYSSSPENSFHLGVVEKGVHSRVLVIAASTNGQPEAKSTYAHLSSDYASLLRDSAQYYRQYLDHTVSLELPDSQLQQAYDWSRISTVQGLVTNPWLGTGLVAGYRTSGNDGRPGFAWYFGRDSLWTDLALDAEGDFSTARTALDFIGKYQRTDGKIPHEIAQTASLVDWFKNYPYPYASADATPLYIIAMNDYVQHSGDIAFAKEKWNSLWKAYQFLISTYDSQGLPRNLGIGHGWVEGGPLLPVESELYQSGLGADALLSLSRLAERVGKNDVSQQLAQMYDKQKLLVDQTFWSPEKNFYSFAVGTDNKRVDVTGVLTTVPMWFGLLDPAKSEATINQLAEYDQQSDWGMRIISSRDPRYNPGGYHFGAVWPLFTGWASVGEYRYHRALPAYSNLRANALLALNGSPGHVTEVLSGNYYESLSTASPHQIWSAAMVVSPMLRGMLGLDVTASPCRLRFAPHLPEDWTFLRVKNIQAGGSTFDLTYRRNAKDISLEMQRNGNDDCEIEFSPALSLRAEVLRADLGGKRVPAQIEPNSIDQHVTVNIPAGQSSHTLTIGMRHDFGFGLETTLPPLGSTSQGLRVTSRQWNSTRDALTVEVSGLPGRQYDLPVWGAEEVGLVEGGGLVDSNGRPVLRIDFPASDDVYAHKAVMIHFSKNARLSKAMR